MQHFLGIDSLEPLICYFNVDFFVKFALLFGILLFGVLHIPLDLFFHALAQPLGLEFADIDHYHEQHLHAGHHDAEEGYLQFHEGFLRVAELGELLLLGFQLLFLLLVSLVCVVLLHVDILFGTLLINPRLN